TYELPIPLDDDSFNFSFSGLKSAVINLAHREKQAGRELRMDDLATSFQNRVVEVLTKKTMRALKEYKVNNLVIAGGVAANKGLRKRFEHLTKEENINLIVPEFRYCTDNAAMIGSAAYYAYKLGRITDLNLKAKSTLVLE